MDGVVCSLYPVFGCFFLALNLRDALQKFYASDIGTDNELLTQGNAGNAAWLASIQRTKGGCRGHHSEMQPVPVPRAKKKAKSKKKVRAGVGAAEDDASDDDDDGLELAPIKPKTKSRR